ncbi:MAG: hypothetical protein ABSA54_22915 [Terriglobales bacterium]
MRRKNLIKPGDFKDLTDQTREAAEPEVSTFISQLQSDRDDGTKSHAADICEILQVDNETRKPLGDAGLAMFFKLIGVLGVHAADKMQHNFSADLGLFNGHDTPSVPYAALNVNSCVIKPVNAPRIANDCISTAARIQGIFSNSSSRPRAQKKARCAISFSTTTRSELYGCGSMPELAKWQGRIRRRWSRI